MDPSSILPPYLVARNEASYILSLCGTPEPLPPLLDAQSCLVGDREDPRMQGSWPKGPLLAIGF